MTERTWPPGITPDGSSITTVTRLAIYDAWQAAAGAAAAMRMALAGRVSWAVALEAYDHVATVLDELRARLPLGAALLLPRLPRADALDASHLPRIEHLAGTLSDVLADEAPLRVGFAPLPLARELERPLLAAVVAEVPRHRSNARCYVSRIASAARVPMADARRAVCTWLERWLVCLPSDDARRHGNEAFLVLESLYEHAAADRPAAEPAPQRLHAG